MRRIVYTLFALLLAYSSALAAEKDPLLIVVSLKEQNLKVYRSGEVIAESNVSSGKRGHTTPTGVFSILGKSRHHRSNIYSGAPMPFMQRLTWSGIALHASNSVPRRPASHGCVRLPHKFARQLFKYDTRGAHVIIEQDTPAPQSISHSALFQPIKTVSASDDYDAWLKELVSNSGQKFIEPNKAYPSRIFITRRTHKDDLYETQRLLNKLGFDAGDVDDFVSFNIFKIFLIKISAVEMFFLSTIAPMICKKNSC